MTNESSAARGVREAWDYWLSDHPVSVPEIIEVAVRDAFAEWLNSHADEIIAAIAERNRA
jgi:hypothetical protein